MALNIENILLKEERKEYNQGYLNNTAGKQIQYTTSILFKLVYLLPREEHNQDKNHWKGELKKEIKNCFFADSFITSNTFKKKYYKESIDEIKKLNNKIVIELSNKDDKKHIPYFVKYGFKKIKENCYEFKRNN